MRPLKVRLARTAVEADYRISLCIPKTHRLVIVTAAIKNITVGSLLRDQADTLGKVLSLSHHIPSRILRSRLLAPIKAYVPSVGGNDKWKIHQGCAAMNLNLCMLARKVAPHLAVIDGFEAMEGDGPVVGTKVDWRLALASADAVAADSVTSSLMGFPSEEIGYLHYCHVAGLGQSDLAKIEILGESFAACFRRFQPPSDYEVQQRWRLAGAESYFQQHEHRTVA